MKILMLNYEFPPIGGGGGQAHLALLHQYAGRPELKICPTFIYAGKPKEDFIRSMYLRFPRVAEGAAKWALGGETKHEGRLNGDNDEVSLVATGPEKFYHLVPYTRDKTVYYSVVQGDKKIAAGKVVVTGEYAYVPGAVRPHRLKLRIGQLDAADLEADLMPTRPRIKPPVGKSGPGIMLIRSSIETAGLSITAMQASITSPRLCGGMLVAMPTAMPPAPLTKRFGNFAGRTVGSRSRPS